MPHPTTPAALPVAAPLPSPGKKATLFTNRRPGNAAAPASFDNDDVDDGRHGRTRRTRRRMEEVSSYVLLLFIQHLLLLTLLFLLLVRDNLDGTG